VRIHENILQRYEQKQHFGYEHFALSLPYANILSALLGIIITHPNQNNQSMMSLTGIQKLDNLINSIKIKAFECINMILKFVFEQMQSSVKN
jgi:hypothetical protein